jgi:hypothetical protein
MQFTERRFRIGFKIPKSMVEVEKKMTVFNFGLQIAEFRFVRVLQIAINSQSTI